ncbi:uncharacterized protein LAESUDRAFT_759918 [Laetiporus sulphureus 93-53]|uniref:Uncharacterized protein n=1 Tax=Laetiporus sulphureus 93-53 TaxID=1314785 RepID=A0A165DUX1_9APHY|nr:uncharacterized protein LAESUDRAFT_759918 [Laetiporus sulphureus 93-53]KZT05674.1 hypothetical protein LAESUDRAFT_759918 [Laetiporus sulphureus 93-53]
MRSGGDLDCETIDRPCRYSASTSNSPQYVAANGQATEASRIIPFQPSGNMSMPVLHPYNHPSPQQRLYHAEGREHDEAVLTLGSPSRSRSQDSSIGFEETLLKATTGDDSDRHLDGAPATLAHPHTQSLPHRAALASRLSLDTVQAEMERHKWEPDELVHRAALKIDIAAFVTLARDYDLLPPPSRDTGLSDVHKVIVDDGSTDIVKVDALFDERVSSRAQPVARDDVHGRVARDSIHRVPSGVTASSSSPHITRQSSSSGQLLRRLSRYEDARESEGCTSNISVHIDSNNHDVSITMQRVEDIERNENRTTTESPPSNGESEMSIPNDDESNPQEVEKDTEEHEDAEGDDGDNAECDDEDGDKEEDEHTDDKEQDEDEDEEDEIEHELTSSNRKDKTNKLTHNVVAKSSRYHQKNAHARRIQELMVDFLALPRTKPLQPVNFRDVIMSEPNGIRPTLDRQGYQRIVAGIFWTNKKGWERLFEGPAWHDTSNALQHARQSIKVASVSSVVDRLTCRAELIHSSRHTSTAQLFLHRLLAKIDIIKWAVDYAALDNSSKMPLLRQIFKAQHPHLFSDVSDKDPWHSAKPQFMQWQKHMANEITMYNRMLEMYTHFGSIILMDPVWSENALRSHSHSTVHSAMLQLSQHMAATIQFNGHSYHGLSPLQPAIEQSLLAITEILAGPFVAQYVYEFMDHMQESLIIDPWPGFDKHSMII